MNNIKCRSFRKDSSAFVFRFLFFLPLFTFHFSLFTFSQVTDSIRSAFHKKPKLMGYVSSKNTFINGFLSPIYTACAGLDFNHTIRVGGGMNWIQLTRYRNGINNTPFYLDKTFTDDSGIHTVHPALQFKYVNVFFEYVYFQSHKWQFSVPIDLGAGTSYYRYVYNVEKIIQDKHGVLLYEPTVSGQYKIFRWLGAELDVGYRMMLISNKNIGGKFNSPILNAGLFIYWTEMYRMVFPKQ